MRFLLDTHKPWLRDIGKRWAADDLPKRRSTTSRGGLGVRHHLGCVARLSASLRMRPDRGEVPAALDRAAMEAFLNRLAYLQSAGQIGADLAFAFHSTKIIVLRSMSATAGADTGRAFTA